MRGHGDEGGVPRVRIRPAVRIGSGAWSVRHRSGRRPQDGRQRTASPSHLHPGAPRSPFRANPCPNSQTTSGRWHLRRSPCWIRAWLLLHADIAQQGPVRPILRDRDLSPHGHVMRECRGQVSVPDNRGRLRARRNNCPSRQRSGSNSVSGGRLDELPECRVMGPQCIRALEELARPESRSDVSACASMTERGSVRSPAVRPASTYHVGRARPGDAGASCGSIHRPEHQPSATTHA